MMNTTSAVDPNMHKMQSIPLNLTVLAQEQQLIYTDCENTKAQNALLRKSSSSIIDKPEMPMPMTTPMPMPMPIQGEHDTNTDMDHEDELDNVRRLRQELDKIRKEIQSKFSHVNSMKQDNGLKRGIQKPDKSQVHKSRKQKTKSQPEDKMNQHKYKDDYMYHQKKKKNFKKPGYNNLFKNLANKEVRHLLKHINCEDSAALSTILRCARILQGEYTHKERERVEHYFAHFKPIAPKKQAKKKSEKPNDKEEEIKDQVHQYPSKGEVQQEDVFPKSPQLMQEGEYESEQSSSDEPSSK